MPIIYEGDSTGNVVIKGANGKSYRLKTFSGNTSNAVPITRGGTGASTVSAAKTNLGIGALGSLDSIPDNSVAYQKLLVQSSPGQNEILSFQNGILKWKQEIGSGDTIVNINQQAPDISGGTLAGDSVNILIDSSTVAYELHLFTDSAVTVSGAGSSAVVDAPIGTDQLSGLAKTSSGPISADGDGTMSIATAIKSGALDGLTDLSSGAISADGDGSFSLATLLTTGCPAGVETNSKSVGNSATTMSTSIPANSGWVRISMRTASNSVMTKLGDTEISVGSGVSDTINLPRASTDNEDSYLAKVFYIYWPATN